MKTVLITGCSSGYGLETARFFHTKGWNVVATMRTPDAAVLRASDRLRVVPLDVTKPDSIEHALTLAGPIDVLVNNAGIGLFGAFEATPMSTVREIFETNTFGTMAMTQAVLPEFRKRRSGMIINVTSTVSMAPFPLVAAYTASKTAIEGFTESLALELADFGVLAKLVEPGYCPTTSLGPNGGARMEGLVTEPYQAFAHAFYVSLQNQSAVTTESSVAEAIWCAANDQSGRLRYPAGDDAIALARQEAARSSGIEAFP